MKHARRVHDLERSIDFVYFSTESGSVDAVQGSTFDAVVLALPTQEKDWTPFSLCCGRVINMCSRNFGPLAMPRLPFRDRRQLSKASVADSASLQALIELEASHQKNGHIRTYFEF